MEIIKGSMSFFFLCFLLLLLLGISRFLSDHSRTLLSCFWESKNCFKVFWVRWWIWSDCKLWWFSLISNSNSPMVWLRRSSCSTATLILGSDCVDCFLGWNFCWLFSDEIFGSFLTNVSLCVVQINCKTLSIGEAVYDKFWLTFCFISLI